MFQPRYHKVIAAYVLSVVFACAASADIALDQEALPLLKEVQTQVGQTRASQG